MSELYQAVKGMNDVLPPDSSKWGHLEARARASFERHGYREVRTPIVEYSNLFLRSLGDTGDVVEKQMYTFDDRDGRSVTLRPEGTASCVRAYLEHSLHKREPVTRWYYSGPMFRHERAQKGRYRQFYQMGVEAFGEPTPTVDAEQISMLLELFRELGIPDLVAKVNHVGGPEDRPAYRAALVAYFEPHRAELCEDCQRRLDRNPLRVLDCKNPSCQRLAAGAPSILEHLGEASRRHFDGVRAALEALEVRFVVDARLVRGLDYYTGTTFEIVSGDGDVGALGGGGRYDRMVEECGGPPTAAVGFAFGVERAVLSIPAEAASFDPRPDAFLAAHGDAARLACLKLARRLRAEGLRVDLDHRGGSMKSQLKRANALGARTVLVIGDDELARKEVALRDMSAGQQRAVPEAGLLPELRKLLAATGG
jgi:histidyl-tRNA synthetase